MTLRRIPCWRLRLSGTVAAIASAALVAVCARPTAPGAFAQEAAPCAALAGRSVEPALIGLPSGPARIASATVERLPASPAAVDNDRLLQGAGRNRAARSGRAADPFRGQPPGAMERQGCAIWRRW